VAKFVLTLEGSEEVEDFEQRNGIIECGTEWKEPDGSCNKDIRGGARQKRRYAMARASGASQPRGHRD
jgi:hypothetical protein